jgi:hypothetical protein
LSVITPDTISCLDANQQSQIEAPNVAEQETHSGSLTACSSDKETMQSKDSIVTEAAASDDALKCDWVFSTNNGREHEAKGNERSQSGYQELGSDQNIA